jgi:glycosyltransferase A (GT-A) superfamily protein (DUF2064 family)
MGHVDGCAGYVGGIEPMTGLATLIVLAKQPLPGKAKTRLTPPLRAEQAATVAAAALADTIATASATTAGERLLAFDGDPAGWVPSGWRVSAQPTGDLDVRLIAAFGAADPDRPAVLVGMDTPQFRPAQIESFDVHRYDACLGFATDGGYWAIGLRQPGLAAAVISGVAMSTPHTGAQQLQRLLDAGLRVQLLDELSDFDTFDAACSLARIAPSGSFAQAMRALGPVRA